MSDFQKYNYQKEEYLKIRELFIKKKYDKVIKSSTIYLDMFPNDINIRFMRAKSYRYLKHFEEAIDDLKYNLKLENNNHSYVELFYILYYLNRYNEALKLLPYLYDNKLIKPISLYLMESIMKKQLGKKVHYQKCLNCEYFKNQIFNYDETRALEHVLLHKNGEEDKSMFNESVDIKYLFEVVKNGINHENKVNKEESLEIHYYGISNIGISANASANYIKVALIPNTTNIITMFPVCDIDDNDIEMLEYDRNKLFKKEEAKVKRLSQIDKFNNRYKRV